MSKRGLVLNSQVEVAPSKELEFLQKLLHFPEEVALQLTRADFEIFREVCTLDCASNFLRLTAD